MNTPDLIKANLFVLGRVPRHMRLRSRDGRFTFDRFWSLQPVVRLWRGESRDQLCDDLAALVEEVSYLHAQTLQEPGFKELLRDAVSGIDNQIEFYCNDVRTVARLITIRDHFNHEVVRSGSPAVETPPEMQRYSNRERERTVAARRGVMQVGLA